VRESQVKEEGNGQLGSERVAWPRSSPLTDDTYALA